MRTSFYKELCSKFTTVDGHRGYRWFMWSFSSVSFRFLFAAALQDVIKILLLCLYLLLCYIKDKASSKKSTGHGSTIEDKIEGRRNKKVVKLHGRDIPH